LWTKLEIQIDERPSFLDLDTGEVRTVAVELLHEAEACADDEEPDFPEWQRHEWEAARRIVFSGRFQKLPTKHDVHEWEIMRDFADSLEPGPVQEDLLHAIHGPGAFRNFKYNLRRHGIEKAWYAFETAALREIAIEWCEEHGIAWK
jgi:hypothetical protein